MGISGMQLYPPGNQIPSKHHQTVWLAVNVSANLKPGYIAQPTCDVVLAVK